MYESEPSTEDEPESLEELELESPFPVEVLPPEAPGAALSAAHITAGSTLTLLIGRA